MNVDSSGFDSFIGPKKTASKQRSAKEVGISAGRWPTADEVADSIKKTGATSGAADVSRTTTQFLDPAYFDPLLFFIQHRDRKELNFRLRHAYEYEPIVRNLIDLHRTLPLSDYSLNCKDKSIERDFRDFADRRELLTMSSYILGDWFLLGEACINKVWDDFEKEWKQINLLPPEKVEARRTYLVKDPLLMLHVDSDLKRLVNSADPVDQEIAGMMDPKLVEQIKTQNRIYLPPHQAYLFANKTSETDLRGSSILKSGLYALLLKYKVRLLHNTYLDRAAFPLKVFKLGDSASKWVPSRAHFEALRNMLAAACFSEDTEILTENGFKFHWEVQEGEKLATVDPVTGEMLYKSPSKKFVYDWPRQISAVDSKEAQLVGAGNIPIVKDTKRRVQKLTLEDQMVHFKTNALDCLVTPNHKMLVRRGGDPTDPTWRSKRADQVAMLDQFRCVADQWSGNGEVPESVEIAGHKIKLDDFVELAGYFVTEGYSRIDSYQAVICQDPKSDLTERLEKLIERSKIPLKKYIQSGRESKIGEAEYRCSQATYVWYKKEAALFFSKNFGEGAKNKHLSAWIKNLPKPQLKILLEAMILGDGTTECCEWDKLTSAGNMCRSKTTRHRFYTSSPQLARDVQEICFKLGYASHTRRSDRSPISKLPSYVISIIPSEGRKIRKGAFPVVYKRDQITQVPYSGKVFCYEVFPHHTLVTRRNGKILVSQNSNDPDFPLSEDTQLLTEDGWKFYHEIAPKDKVATLNPKTGVFEYYVPTHFTVRDYEGEMVHIKNDTLDVLTTPKHWHWVQPIGDKNNHWKEVRAGDLTGSYKMRIGPDSDSSSEDETLSTIKQQHISRVPYKGKIFCPTVPPNHLIFARRNGKTFVTRQCLLYHYGLCLTAGSKITLPDGSTSDIENLKSGDKLQGGWRDGEPVEVVKMSPLPYKGEMLTIDVTGTDHPIQATPNHKFPALMRTSCVGRACGSKHSEYCNSVWAKKRVNQPISWVYARQLRVGDYLIAPQQHPEKPTSVTLDQARLLGYYIAEGFTQKINGKEDKGVRFSMHGEKDASMIQDIIDTALRWGCNKPKMYVPKHSPVSVVLSIHSPMTVSTEIAKFLVHYGGKKARTKRLAEEIFYWPKAHKLELIRGYFMGDGYCGVQSVYSSTSSKVLAQQLMRLFQICGFAPIFKTDTDVQTRSNYPNAHEAYRIYMYGNSAKKIKNLVTGRPLEAGVIKAEDLNVLPKVMAHNGWVQYRIRKVSSQPFDGTVYNLETTEPRHFIANFVSSHNSIEYHGLKDKWEDLMKHYTWADNELMTSLFASEALLRPKGTTFSNSNVSVRVLLSRYQTIRTYVELLWKNQIFRPMAEAREYWIPDSAGRMGNVPVKQRNGKYYYLDVPNFKWSKLNLLDDTAQKQFLMRLLEKGQVPWDVIVEIFDGDPEEWRQKLKEQEGTVIDPAYLDARKKAASDPMVTSQILQGKKTKEWVLPKQDPKEEADKLKRKKQLDNKPDQSAADMGSAPAAPAGPAGPAGKAPGAPNAGENPPGTEPPGSARERPQGAPTGGGTPGETPPTGGGVMTPPI